MANREERERLRQQRLAAEASRGSSDRRRLILGYIVAGVLAAAVLAGLVAVFTSGDGDGDGPSVDADNAHIEVDFGVFEGYEPDDREGTPPPELQFGDLEESAQMAGCETKLDLPDEGANHFEDENMGTYKTNPPTSGDHYGVPTETASGPVADGAYLTTPPESRLVHSMEHGRVEIRYDPNLPEDQQLEIKGVFDEDPDGILMFPDGEAPYAPQDTTEYAVALTAWRNLIICPTYDPVVLDVIRNFRDTFRGNGPENVPVP